MKYLNQKKYPHWLYITRTEMDEENREHGKTTTVSSSGCGICAAVMVADRLLPDCAFDLADGISMSYEVKANTGIGTDFTSFAPAFAQKLGLKLETSYDVEDVRRCVRTGGAATVLVTAYGEGQGLFTHSLHWITVIGEEPDGRLAILDPSLTETKYDEEGRRGRVEIKNGVIVLCDAQTLANEVYKDMVPYYLFWRG